MQNPSPVLVLLGGSATKSKCPKKKLERLPGSFSRKALPLRQGNLPSHDLFRFLEEYFELGNRIFSILGDTQGMCPIAHIKMTPTWLRWAKT
jgi:hypothetical protein